MTTLRFEDPPVRHVHLTLRFSLSNDLMTSHLSSLREQWKTAFPRTQEKAPHPQSEHDLVRVTRGGSSWPMPYVMYTADDKGIVIEADKFALTWTFGTSEPYPTYDLLREELRTRWREFCTAVQSELDELPILVGSECQYTNEMPDENPGQMIFGLLTSNTRVNLEPTDLESIIYQGFRQHRSGSNTEELVDVLVGVDLLHGSSHGTELFIETSRDLQPDDSFELAGIDVAHEVLIQTFLGCTRTDQHEAWGRLT